jgi:fido (protein-threonine AMPylation protein)
MSYIEEKKSGKKTAVYLTKNIRLGGKFRKVRVLLGYKPLNGLEALRKTNEPLLEKKVEELISSEKEEYKLLSEEERKSLEQLARNYQKAIKGFDPTTKQKYLDWFLTQFTYDSNAIEGSSVPLEEVGLILFDKAVSSDRNLREVYEVQNHKKAYDFITKHKGDFNLKFILDIHRRLMSEIVSDAGKLRNVRVFVRGSELKPPKPEEAPKRLEGLVEWYKSNKSLHPVILAAHVHSEFEQIHPFTDGNGRTGRLLLNFILMKNDFPPINILNERKGAYYSALKSWDQGDKRPFVELVISYIKDSVEFVDGS